MTYRYKQIGNRLIGGAIALGTPMLSRKTGSHLADLNNGWIFTVWLLGFALYISNDYDSNTHRNRPVRIWKKINSDAYMRIY